MVDLAFERLTEESFASIPSPAQPGARCQSCDYWERIDGGRGAPEEGAPDAASRERLKRSRLLGSRVAAGPFATLAYRTDAVDRVVVGYAQFGALSQYPRAQSIRDRYPALPESPAPWVITCLQVSPTLVSGVERAEVGAGLLEAVCADLDQRGITAVEAYPEHAPDPWSPSPGPVSVYEAAGFDRVAGDDRYPVYRRELSGETDAGAWSELLQAAKPEEDDGWPLPVPPTPDPDEFFRLPPEKPQRPNPFGDD